MVIGKLRIESTHKVKDNPYYGNYEAKSVYTHTIKNEKYVGLVSPKNGIHIILKGGRYNDNIEFFISKYYITGELEKDFNQYTDFSVSFGFNGHIYEITVDENGQLISFDEWFSSGDFEDGNEPDNHYTKRSSGIKWELIDE